MDDTLLFGTASAMHRAVGQLAPAIRRGAYRLSDEEYAARWPAESAAAAPNALERPQPGGPELPWREPYAEILLQHHVRAAGLRVCGLGLRSKLATLGCGAGEQRDFERNCKSGVRGERDCRCHAGDVV